MSGKIALEIISRDRAIKRMNRWGERGKSFLFLIDFEMQKPLVIPLEKAKSMGILYQIEGKQNFTTPQLKLKKEFKFERFPISIDHYEKSFKKVKRAIQAGNTFLTNLTFPTPIETDLSFEEIFYQSSSPFKLWIQDHLVVFSPERFVKIDGNKIKAYPMKGTINAEFPDAEKMVLNDPKETAEHHTIVDLIRNDLSKIADNVFVEKFRYITEIRTNNKRLLQVSSEIVGTLPPNYAIKLGDLLFSLLPAGSISGAPKQKTIELIQEAEIDKRGYYTGVFGYFDGKCLNSAVLIRYIEQNNQVKLFRSGGGITLNSDKQKEYQELIDKVYVSFS